MDRKVKWSGFYDKGIIQNKNVASYLQKKSRLSKRLRYLISQKVIKLFNFWDIKQTYLNFVEKISAKARNVKHKSFISSITKAPRCFWRVLGRWNLKLLEPWNPLRRNLFQKKSSRPQKLSETKLWSFKSSSKPKLSHKSFIPQIFLFLLALYSASKYVITFNAFRFNCCSYPYYKFDFVLP